MSHQPSPLFLYHDDGSFEYVNNGIPAIYVADPAIAKLPNGDYVMAHSLFGPHFRTGGIQTKIFRSTDNGRTWAKTHELAKFLNGSLFALDGAVYLIGSLVTATTVVDGKPEPSAYNIAILKSPDNGQTWTTPHTGFDGLLIEGAAGTTKTPVVHDGRVWLSLATSYAYSAPVGADLLKASSWTRSEPASSKSAAAKKLWPDFVAREFEGTWTEAQILASPAHGVTVIPKMDVLHPESVPHTALFHISGDGAAMSFDPARDFVPLPGAQKKFGATYDAVSGRHYALTNTILPADTCTPFLTTGKVTPAAIRNTLTLCSSSDLHHWDVEKIMLHSRDAQRTGWQYVTFIIDGDDLAVASRTAIQFPGDPWPAPTGHDSNRLTFHRFENFRDAAPGQFLRIEDGAVRRYERTDCEDAPLGDFSPGHVFAAPPNALAQAAGGTVYIRETGGRAHVFDAHGNHLETLPSVPAGVTIMTGGTLALAPAPAGERSWLGLFTDDWYDPRNWRYWGRPDTPEETAIFGSANTTDAAGAGAATIVTLAQSHTLAGLVFHSPRPYKIVRGVIANTAPPAAVYDSGALMLRPAGAGRRALLAARGGAHTVAVPLALPADTGITAGAGAALAFGDGVAFGGELDIALALGAGAPDAAPLVFKTLSKSSSAARVRVALRNAPAAAPAGVPVLKITGAHSLAAADFSVDNTGAGAGWKIASFSGGVLTVAPSAGGNNDNNNNNPGNDNNGGAGSKKGGGGAFPPWLVIFIISLACAKKYKTKI
ncbi:MAG: glycoside hydrolase [Opitutaceae bacterium]|nr:glycoside hydrolase [Opitutaceae bacterium]